MSKNIVLIESMPEARGKLSIVLDQSGINVHSFSCFEDALSFIENNKVDLIVSDLIFHNDLDFVDSFVRNIFSRKINYAIWRGNALSDCDEDIKKLSLFFEGLPENYDFKVEKDKLNQQQIDCIVESFHNKQKQAFSFFSRKRSLKDIIDYFF